MAIRFRDLAGARALVAGTGSHTVDSGLPDVPAVADTLVDLRRVLIDRCGMAPDSVRVLLDPASSGALGQAVAEVTEQAGDLVLVYYVGHGVITTNGP